jgi:hypothetical protein
MVYLFVGGVCGGGFFFGDSYDAFVLGFFFFFFGCVCLVGVAGDDVVRWSAVFDCIFKELGGVGGCRVW